MILYRIEPDPTIGSKPEGLGFRRKPTTSRFGLVELIGIEPTTSWLQTRRSPS